MKCSASVYLLLLLVCSSTQIPKYEDCSENLEKKIPSKDCVKVKCFSTELGFELQACDSITCALGTEIGYHVGNDTKEYPECCSYPICSE